MDLDGARSIAVNTSAGLTTFENPSIHAYAVIPFTQNTERLLNGFYFSPSWFRTSARAHGTVMNTGTDGWMMALGRGNLNFPGSTFRGFLQIAYRQTKVRSDPDSNWVINSLSLSKSEEQKKSLLVTLGTSTTQTTLVSQKKPHVDSELVLTMRYDYEEGDFITWLKASAFYPTLFDLGVTVGWNRVFAQKQNQIYENVSDAIVFGPRIRGRAWGNLAVDFALEWPAIHGFAGTFVIQKPRAHTSLIFNF